MLHRAASSLHAAAIQPGVGVAASASASRAPRVAAAAAARRPTNPIRAADDACRFFRRPRRPRHDRHHRTYHSRWAVSTYGKDPTVPDSDYDGYDDELEEYERDGDPHTKNIDRAGKGYVVEEREHGGAVGQLSDAERDLILEGIPNMYDPSEYPDEEEEEEEEEEDDDAVAGDVVAAARRAAAAFASRKDDPGSPSPSQPSQPADDPALAPGLYLVGTPIGNLEDITLRALRVLRTADVVLAEDTRHTRRLLRAYDVDAAALTSYHAHNERSRRDGVMDRLRRGGAVALVSDAGTPAVADPGGDLAAACAAEGIRVVPIPGPCAPAAAVIAAGLGTARFTFAGFLPAKSGARRKQLEELRGAAVGTTVFFVPPHKLVATLEDAVAVLGEGRRCAVCREMTKVHEEFWRGTLADAVAEFTSRKPRGEITLVVETGGGESGGGGGGGEASTGEGLDRALREMLDDGESPSEASKRAVRELGAKRKEAYAAALRLAGKTGGVDADA